MTDKRYREAVKELIQKGYLVKHHKYKSVYIFYEFPTIDNAIALPNEIDNIPNQTYQPVRNDSIEMLFWESKKVDLTGEKIDNITSQIQNNTYDNTLSKTNFITNKEINDTSFPSLENEDLPF